MSTFVMALALLTCVYVAAAAEMETKAKGEKRRSLWAQ